MRELEGRLEVLAREHLTMKKGHAEVNSEELEMYQNENIKLKKINNQLLEEIKNLKVEL